MTYYTLCARCRAVATDSLWNECRRIAIANQAFSDHDVQVLVDAYLRNFHIRGHRRSDVW